jgi:hypothetical protein
MKTNRLLFCGVISKFCCATLAIFAAMAQSFAATVVLPPVADTCLRADHPATNYLSEPDLAIRNRGQLEGKNYDANVLMRFDLSRIPPGSSITKATLVVWETASYTLDQRLGWIYENATDAGWPIQNSLKITHKATPRGAMLSDVLHWQAADASILEIEAAFTSATPTTQVDVEIQPFAPADRTDFPAWEVASPAIIEETAQKKKAFPSAPPIVIPLTVPGDGQLRTHTLNLADNPAYRGAMKQLRLRLPATDGTADVRRIELRR